MLKARSICVHSLTCSPTISMLEHTHQGEPAAGGPPMRCARDKPIIAGREEPRVHDRRAWSRTQVALRVDYADTQGHAQWGIARNLSRGGLFLDYTPGLSMGETITCAFVLPTGQPYKGRAHVVRLHQGGAGLQCVDPLPPIGELSERCAALAA